VSEQAPRGGAARAAKRFLVLLVVVALGGTALVLFSMLHSKTWAIEQHEGELWIVKGRMGPAGYEPFRPADKMLAAAYAPVPLWGDSPGQLVEAPFDDRDALDQALFLSLKSRIESRIGSDDAERLAQAFTLLRRAEQLNGASTEQREQLKDLQAKMAYLEGRTKLEAAERTLREAVNRLQLASETQNRYTREASELYERMAPLAEQLGKVVRQTALAQTAPAKASMPLPAEKAPPGPPNLASSSSGADAGASTPTVAAEELAPDASAAAP